MNKELIIVFVKNIKLGKVKTRLAKSIGNQGAFEVYSELVKVTEKATQNINIDKRIYFSDAIVETKWEGCHKAVQEGLDLGERMKNAFTKGFNDGYKRIVLIGSDLPDITANHIGLGLKKLVDHEVVIGPADDGGYYLIGLSKMYPFVFENKPWSEPHLLDKTQSELNEKKVSFDFLEPLNDIDTLEDLEASSFYKSNVQLQERIKNLNYL